MVYATAAEAAKLAAAFDRSDIANLGRHASWLGMVPLVLARLISPRREMADPSPDVLSPQRHA